MTQAPSEPMDAAYIFRHSKFDDFEIRYSLRSLAKHAPYIRKVWIFGDKPAFMSPDTSVIEHVPESAIARVLKVKLPVQNFLLLMVLQSFIPGLAYEYLCMSDDFFILRDLPIAEAREDRYIEDMSLNKNRARGLWVDGLWRTYDTLIRLGYTGLNFETHVPAYLTRKRVLEAYCDLQDFITEDRWFGMTGPTAILNHAHRKQKLNLVNITEKKQRLGFWGKPPTYEDITSQLEGKVYFNFDDDAYSDDVRRFLMERFPERCRYEA